MLRPIGAFGAGSRGCLDNYCVNKAVPIIRDGFYNFYANYIRTMTRAAFLKDIQKIFYNPSALPALGLGSCGSGQSPSKLAWALQ